MNWKESINRILNLKLDSKNKALDLFIAEARQNGLASAVSWHARLGIKAEKEWNLSKWVSEVLDSEKSDFEKATEILETIKKIKESIFSVFYIQDNNGGAFHNAVGNLEIETTIRMFSNMGGAYSMIVAIIELAIESGEISENIS